MVKNTKKYPSAIDAHMDIKGGLEGDVQKEFDKWLAETPDRLKKLRYEKYDGIKGAEVEGGSEFLMDHIYQNTYKDVAKNLEGIADKDLGKREKAILGVLESFLLPTLRKAHGLAANEAEIYEAVKNTKGFKTTREQIQHLKEIAHKYLANEGVDQNNTAYVDALVNALESQDALYAREQIAQFKERLKSTLPAYLVKQERLGITRKAGEEGEEKAKLRVLQKMRTDHGVEPRDYATFRAVNLDTMTGIYHENAQNKDKRRLKLAGLKPYEAPKKK